MDKILVVEDDTLLGNNLFKVFRDEGFSAEVVTSLKSANEKELKNFRLIILDWMLPDGQGVDFLKQVRARNISIPIILLTSRADLIDKVIGLESGANDYMTKPFEPRELVARVRVQLRDTRKNLEKNEFHFGALTLKTSSREVFFQGVELSFTKMEFDLLRILIENPGQVFSRENLLDQVWGYENYPTTRTVDTHVLQIRQKTYDEIIVTQRGLGYKLGQELPKKS